MADHRHEIAVEDSRTGKTLARIFATTVPQPPCLIDIDTMGHTYLATRIRWRIGMDGELSATVFVEELRDG